MAIIFSDNFDTGTEPNVTNWTENNGTIALSSQRVTFAGSTSTFNYMTTKVAAHAAIADVQVNLTRRATTGWDAGPFLRSNVANSGYYLDVVDGSTHQIYRRVTGSDTAVGASFSFTNATGDIYGLKATGTNPVVLEVFKNGVSQGTRSDSDAARLQGAGQTGIMSWNASGIMDDFEVDDLSAGGVVEKYHRRRIRIAPFAPGADRTRWR